MKLQGDTNNQAVRIKINLEKQHEYDGSDGIAGTCFLYYDSTTPIKSFHSPQNNFALFPRNSMSSFVIL